MKRENLVKNNFVRSTQNSPASWCKKSDLRLQKCNRRFFARSGESEALPLKAKSGSFWRVGGAGWGVQPFCEKESSENSSEENAESSTNNLVILSETKYLKNNNRDSSVASLPQNDNFRKFAESQKDNFVILSESEISQKKNSRDSSLRFLSAQNDNFNKFAESACQFAFSFLGGLESIRWMGFFFWQKPKEAKTFNKDF